MKKIIATVMAALILFGGYYAEAAESVCNTRQDFLDLAGSDKYYDLLEAFETDQEMAALWAWLPPLPQELEGKIGSIVTFYSQQDKVVLLVFFSHEDCSLITFGPIRRVVYEIQMGRAEG